MTLRQRAVTGAFVAASWLLCLLPRRLTLPAARGVGRQLFHLLSARRRVALENLECALGAELDVRARRRIARESFGHATAIAADLLTLPVVTRDPRAHCEVAPGSLETLRSVLAEGRGAILVAGHFGLFESMGILLGHERIPLSFVSKPFENPGLDAAVNGLRSATGNGFIHKGGAKARAREVLAAGECVAIVVDQHVAARDRLWVPFFGLPAATTRSLGTLAVASGAPVVPIHSFPLPRGRCRLEFGPVLRPAGTGADAADAEALVHATIAEMELATRRCLPAWLWLHRRWKVRPDGASGYPSHARTESEEAAVLRAREAAAAASVGEAGGGSGTAAGRLPREGD